MQKELTRPLTMDFVDMPEVQDSTQAQMNQLLVMVDRFPKSDRRIDIEDRAEGLLEQEQDDCQQLNIRAAIELYERGILPDPTNPIIRNPGRCSGGKGPR